MSVISSMVVALSADTAKFEKGMKRAQKVLNSVSKSATLVGGAITSAMGLAAKSFIDASSAAVDMSERTGLTVEAITALKFAAEQSGTTIEAVEKSFKALSKNLVSGSEEFEKFGLSIEELLRLKPDEQFLKVAQRIADMENPTLRSAAAQKLLGKSGAELLPLLNTGSAGIQAFIDKAKEMGLVLDGDAARAGEALGDQIDALKAQLGAIVVQIGSQLVPAIQNLVKWAQDAITQFREWTGASKELTNGIAATGVGLLAFGVIGGSVSRAISGIVSAFKFMLPVITVVVGALSTVEAAIVAVGAAVTGLGIYLYKTSDAFKWIVDNNINPMTLALKAQVYVIDLLLEKLGLLNRANKIEAAANKAANKAIKNAAPQNVPKPQAAIAAPIGDLSKILKDFGNTVRGNVFAANIAKGLEAARKKLEPKAKPKPPVDPFPKFVGPHGDQVGPGIQPPPIRGTEAFATDSKQFLSDIAQAQSGKDNATNQRKEQIKLQRQIAGWTRRMSEQLEINALAQAHIGGA